MKCVGPESPREPQRAKDTKLHRDVTLKVLRAEALQKPKSKSKLQRSNEVSW